MKKKVLITGVTGFIGRYVARQFAEAGWEIVGLDKFPPDSALQKTLSRYDQLDLPSDSFVLLLQQVKPQACVHCAGPSSVDLSMKDPTGDFNASIPVTFHVLNGLRLYTPACRVIYLSSAAVYGNTKALPIDETEPAAPISPYGFHKLVCEHLCTEFCKVYGLPTAIVRIFSAYGAGLRRQVLWDICRKALTGEVLKLRGTGNESRDFIHVQDVARAIHLVSEKGSYEGEIYNIASGTETTIKELADLILVQIGQTGRVVFDNRIPVGNPLNWKADISRLIRIGFIPQINLGEGVRTFVSWCREELAKRG